MYVREPVNDLFARLLSRIYIGMVRMASMIVKITIRMTIILDDDIRRALGGWSLEFVKAMLIGGVSDGRMDHQLMHFPFSCLLLF